MDSERLIQMANQIGDFFSADPDHAAAIEGVANHLRRFWEPRMRKQIVEIVDSGHEGLRPLVEETIRLNRERLLGMRPAG